MCGILGIVETPESCTAATHAGRGCQLLARLTHRGPDFGGDLRLRTAWLGHRRLAIVDPQSGPQPLRAGSMAWSANGEIYNHKSLRTGLDMDGLSASDCAVIGPLWARHGLRTPDLLDGQFAFVVADESTGHWMAARDQAGICPLYVGRHRDGSIWFASEMKVLVDDCSHVEIVPPGHAWARDERGVRRFAWYDPAWMHEIPDTSYDPKRLRDTLIDAVLERLMTDVPFGLLLSGGLDSSLIASIAVRLGAGASGMKRFSEQFHTFAIGLEGAPDLAPARRMAEWLGTIHHEFTFTIEEALAVVPAVVHHLESYQQIRTAVPTYLLAQHIKKLGIKMVLSGEGADELFGGYLYFHKAPSPTEFHRETVRKVARLHQFDVMRANKAPMAFGLEVRVPFLDRDFMDLAMSIDPAQKRIDMHARPDGAHPRMEKYILRKAFDDRSDPWLPDSILWRQKEQFSDGVGYDWVDRLREHAAGRLAPGQWEQRAARFPVDTPSTPELYWMRELFEEHFMAGRPVGQSPLYTVGQGRSIACSTPEALRWDPTWSTCTGDISGRAIANVHSAAESFELDDEAAAETEAA